MTHQRRDQRLIAAGFLFFSLFSQVSIYSLRDKLHVHVTDEVYVNLARKLGGRFQRFLIDEAYHNNCIVSQLSACHGSWLDFCMGVLNLEYDRPLYSAFQSLVENCGWIYSFEEQCFVCNRPRQLHFDSEYLLHAEGQPAVEFGDKFSVYFYRSVRLPQTIGQLPPQSSQASWLLTEHNAEVRRVLIQAIGYRRICDGLQTIELDTWQEYTFEKIKNNMDAEPMYLLKMTCPSTGHLHALRVRPEVRSSSASFANG
jgi:hypothetical protein